MATDAQKLALREYSARVRAARRAHPNITEPGLAPLFYELLTGLLPSIAAAPIVQAIPEYQNPGVGRPDIALKRTGEPARAFVELKSLDKPTDGRRWTTAHDRRQFSRFSEFAVWATCNFQDVRLYERDRSQRRASLVPEGALDPDRSDNAANPLFANHDAGPAIELLTRLANAQPPKADDAEHLAELLAYSARLVRGIVIDRLHELRGDDIWDNPLQQVRSEFRDVLYSHPEAAGYAKDDFDELFAGAFAQTLAFGLLLVREANERNLEKPVKTVDRHAFEDMPEEHPLMRTALRVLSMDDVAREIGAGFDVMLDTVNGFEPIMLALRDDGYDPILYFYENFLETFDEEARDRYGVFYTPIEVVRYMSGALDRALRENLGADGLGDGQVHILDPATGTGTFLLGVAERVRRNAIARDGPGQAPLALQGLAERMYGFELLVGPYAVAHYRLHHALTLPTDASEPINLPRLGVYLTDTLAEPHAAAPLGQLGFVSEGIRDERAQSNRIKTEQPILAIIGNPPYRRLEEGENRTLVGHWMDGVWDDLKEPVREAKKGNQLNTFPEFSVAFWRWAIWKLFEAPNAPRRGVIAFITNRKFLTGWPYAGLRKMLRERFNRIEIIDLRGDVRRGERAGAENDQGVFNIKVGTAITLAIADGAKEDGALADIRYNDSWAHNLFSKRAKLDWLEAGADAGRRNSAVPVERGALDDMRPLPFLNGELVSIEECFSYRVGGMQTKRDDFVYGITANELSARIRVFLNAPDNQAKEMFHNSRDRKFHTAKAIPFDESCIIQTSYRPLDIRYLYNNQNYGDFLRTTTLQRVWGEDNVGLYAMPYATGTGPAVWCHGLLPDYHGFSNRGGYAFPLYDRRDGHGPYNLKPELVETLSAAYGGEVTPEQTFNAILCLLSGTSYSTRFAEDLEDVFPHVPFPAALENFTEAAKIGAKIRLVETFARPPGPAFADGLARAEDAPNGPLAAVDWHDGEIRLCDDGSGRISNIPESVWRFAISGYRVLPRWLAARNSVSSSVRANTVSASSTSFCRSLMKRTQYWRARLMTRCCGPRLSRNRMKKAMTETTNLFDKGAGPTQQSFFGQGDEKLQAPAQSFTPRPDDVRKRLEKLLATLRGAASMPWPEREARMWLTVFPNMTKWLPEEEAAQMRSDFKQEIERLRIAA